MMYFPRAFDQRKSLQLADLVVQAYCQLDRYRQNRPWSIDGDYTLATELRYGADSTTSKSGRISQFDTEFRQLAKLRKQREVGLPIGFIAYSRDGVFIVFRGTMTTTEWLRDLRIQMTPYPYTKSGRVHDGFLSTYDIFRKRIIDTLAPISAGKRLYITGHSLGAALATLAIPDVISATPYRSPYAYTYGSPRVGDRDFVAAYNGMMKNRSFRIVNTSDPIVSVPFPAPFLGFLGGYFTHVDMPVDFTVQEENIEKNHGMKTYRTALAGVRRKGLFGYLWR